MNSANRWLIGFAAVLILICGLMDASASQSVAAQKEIIIGVQPLGYPVAMITSVMKRDEILKGEMARRGFKVVQTPYGMGSEMVGLVGPKLVGAFMGDMPTISTATRTKVLAVGLVKQTFSSVVAHNIPLVKDLKGKRVGVALGSSAHHTLLQGLKSAGLSESDIRIAQISIDEMPNALAAGSIDAYSAWEPAPTISLSSDPLAAVIFRGLSSDYFLLADSFEKANREEALLLTASFLRAIEWMRIGSDNLRRAAEWSIVDAESYSGKKSRLTVQQAMDIATREILSIASAPAIINLKGGKPRLSSEFEFLDRLGKLPPGASFSQVHAAFEWDGLSVVNKSFKKYRIKEYRYAK